MISYKRKSLCLNEQVFAECMRLHKVSEQQVDRVYLTEKKRLSRMLQQGDSYDDLVWLICERIGL